MTWTWKWNEYEIENKHGNENEQKKGGQFFFHDWYSFPKMQAVEQLLLPASTSGGKKKNNKQTTEEEEEQKNKTTKNKKQNCFVAQRVLELLQTSFSKLSWAKLAMEREKKFRQMFSHKEVVRKAKHVKARKT